jgi:hypothetical protein
MTTTTTNELTNGTNGRWLGSRLTSTPTGTRGIFCHNVPAVEDIDPKDELAHHTMVTAVAPWAPSVQGELIRWVTAGEVLYEARINGLDEHYGICDAAAFSHESLCALAKVANDLRYMWEAILDPDERGAWSTWSGQR